MESILDRPHVLLAAAEAERALLNRLFTQAPLDRWDLLEADSLERVRFLLQHNTCDALIVDQSLQAQIDVEGLGWLVKFSTAPLVYVSGVQPELVAAALNEGAAQWLPRKLALSHPRLLDAVLQRAKQTATLVDRARQATDELRECRRQANRLVSLLWETSTGEARNRWLSQRQMMERFHEELARSERHGSPLTLVLGELHTSGSGDTPTPREGANVTETWAAEQISRAKRRADVAGQYGPNGFMLLLVHTTEQGATAFCQRLQSLLEQAAGTSSGPPLPTRAFFGVAGYGSNAFTPKALLSRAEEALDRARAAENSMTT